MTSAPHDGRDGYGAALAALCFFGADALAQISASREHQGKLPLFFDGETPAMTNFVMAVHAVLLTYKRSLYEVHQGEDGDELVELEDFTHRLSVLVCREGQDFWSEASVRSSPDWALLRRDARKALSRLGRAPATEGLRFDFDAAIDPDAFRTSPEARRLLD